MQADKPDTVHPVQDGIEELKLDNQELEQEVALLKQQVVDLKVQQAILLERQEVLEKRVDLLVAQQQRANLILLPRRSSHESSAESHGFPVGTERLVSYVGRHKANINEVKGLHTQRMIDLTIHIREGEPKRNKQEWWITPEQQVQLVHYWQEHSVPYTPCGQCEGCMEQVNNSEIG